MKPVIHLRLPEARVKDVNQWAMKWSMQHIPKSQKCDDDVQDSELLLLHSK